MNKQEIFETVAKHLFEQGERSIVGNTCAYRTQDGKSCAVGCLIPNEMYSTDMEGKHILYLIGANIDGAKYNLPDYFKDNVDLLKQLQIVHDMEDSFWETTEKMRNVLNTIARGHGINPDFLNELSFKDR